jgi:translation initiation factor IF-3
MRKAHKELSKGNKVKLVVQFKGREMSSMIPIAEELLGKVFDHVHEIATYEIKPKIQGRLLVGVLVPLK